MGCDIHMHVEVKTDSSYWLHYQELDVPRSYRLFSLLAGVRAEGQPDCIFNPRGLPDDISLLTRLYYEDWGSDAHTPSWLAAKEVSEVLERYDFAGLKKALSLLDYFNAYMVEGITHIRFVFWFDN